MYPAPVAWGMGIVYVKTRKFTAQRMNGDSSHAGFDITYDVRLHNNPTP